MKMIIAVLRPEQLPAVKQSLFNEGIKHFTAMAVVGTAPETEQLMYRGEAREASLFKRVRLEIVAQNDQVEKAVQAITDGAKASGGWGRILIGPLEDAVTIWTGERGEASIK